MNTIKITCPECKHQMEYWTRNNFILCTKCRAVIEVEPTVSQGEVIEITSEEAQQRLKPGAYVDGVEIFAEVRGDEQR
jgi:transcription initiation factor TFIIIB Brf1 subunit/transcription initiation factor TFIIB